MSFIPLVTPPFLNTVINSAKSSLKAPNHEDSILYPYVGELTSDCTDYTLKTGKDSDGNPQIKGFTYETDEYVIKWRRGEEITVTKQSE